MNNKEKIKNILLLSVFILNDKEYIKINNLLENNKFENAKSIIDDLLETKEISIIVNPENQEYVQEYKQLNKLYNLIIDIIVDNGKNDKKKQFRTNITK